MKMKPEILREGKRRTSREIEARLKKKDYQALPDLALLAEKYEVNKPLRIKAWHQAGLYWQREGRQPDAIIALNAARALSPINTKILTAFFTSFDQFLADFRSVFSVEDLDLMTDQVERLLEFYKAKGIWDAPPVAMGKQVYRKINYYKLDAKSAPETKASYQVSRIVTALRENVTLEEVAADYARIMGPIFWELIGEEMDAKEQAPMAAGDGGKRGGGGDEEDEENPKPPMTVKSKVQKKGRLKTSKKSRK